MASYISNIKIIFENLFSVPSLPSSSLPFKSYPPHFLYPPYLKFPFSVLVYISLNIIGKRALVVQRTTDRAAATCSNSFKCLKSHINRFHEEKTSMLLSGCSKTYRTNSQCHQHFSVQEVQAVEILQSYSLVRITYGTSLSVLEF